MRRRPRRCCSGRAIGSSIPRLRASARSAAAGPSSPPASSRRPGPRPGGRLLRSVRSSRRTCRSSASSPPASSPSATSCPVSYRPRGGPPAGALFAPGRIPRRPPAPDLPLRALPQRPALVHGHCHEKAFGLMGSVLAALKLVPDLEVAPWRAPAAAWPAPWLRARPPGGLAGDGGGEPAPSVRGAAADTLLVADGTSCRHQIGDGTDREAVHLARVLAEALT